jgi:hypothetical protein
MDIRPFSNQRVTAGKAVVLVHTPRALHEHNTYTCLTLFNKLLVMNRVLVERYSTAVLFTWGLRGRAATVPAVLQYSRVLFTPRVVAAAVLHY